MIRCSDRCTDGCDCGAAEMNDETRPVAREALLDLLAEAARWIRRDKGYPIERGAGRLVNEIEEAVNRG